MGLGDTMFARGKVDNESEDRPFAVGHPNFSANSNKVCHKLSSVCRSRSGRHLAMLQFVSSRVISGSTIVALGRGRRWQQALYLFDDMQRLKLQRNAFSFASAIGTLEGRTSCFAFSWNFQQHVLAHKHPCAWLFKDCSSRLFCFSLRNKPLSSHKDTGDMVHLDWWRGSTVEVPDSAVQWQNGTG